MNSVTVKAMTRASQGVQYSELYSQSTTAKPLSWVGFTNTPAQWLVQLLLLLILLSALAAVMETSKIRHDYRQLQLCQQQRDAAELQHGRLLLEKSTLLTQARIVQVAGFQSAMAMPTQKMLVVVTE